MLPYVYVRCAAERERKNSFPHPSRWNLSPGRKLDSNFSDRYQRPKAPLYHVLYSDPSPIKRCSVDEVKLWVRRKLFKAIKKGEAGKGERLLR